MNFISDTSKFSFSGHFFPPRGFTILFMRRPCLCPPTTDSMMPEWQSRHWHSKWIQAKDFFFFLIREWKGWKWSFPSTQHYITKDDAKCSHMGASLRAENFTRHSCGMQWSSGSQTMNWESLAIYFLKGHWKCSYYHEGARWDLGLLIFILKKKFSYLQMSWNSAP